MRKAIYPHHNTSKMIDPTFGKPEPRKRNPVTAKIKEKYGTLTQFAKWHNISLKMVRASMASGDTSWLLKVLKERKAPPALSSDDIRKWIRFYYKNAFEFAKQEGINKNTPARASKGLKNSAWFALVCRMRKEGVI